MGTSGSIGSENRWWLLWHGCDRAKPGVVKLFWVVLRFFLASWLWGTAVRLAHFQPPTKTAGVVLASGSVLLAIWALWRFGQALLILGIKRLAITVLVAFALLVAINVLTIPDTRPVGTRFVAQLSASAQQVGNTLFNWAKSAIQAPDDFLFAYSGRREPPPLPPGFPTPNPNATPVQVRTAGSESLPVRIPTPQPEPTVFVEVAPVPTTAGETAIPSLQIGGYVQVVNTGGQPLRARAGPGTDNEIVARFPAGTRLLILDGPKSSDDFIWWKVRSEEGEEGWCADRWLAPIDD